MRIRPVAPYAMLWELLHCGWMVVPLAVLTFDVRYDQVLLNGGVPQGRVVSPMFAIVRVDALCVLCIGEGGRMWDSLEADEAPFRAAWSLKNLWGVLL